jgi:lipoyl(octanoyl) transferase
MAIDEAILESVAAKRQLPTLRLYAWNPFCLSIGHAQRIQDVNQTALAQKGWELVRRPTGGKAILHADEITYSIAAPQDEPIVAGTVIESYQRLSQALLTALKILGISADARPKNPLNTQKPANPICFESPSDFEITSSGKKIIGSAQARRLQGVLQHGSIPLFGDISRIVQVLNYESMDELARSRNELLQKACTLFDILQKRIDWSSAASAIIEGFVKTFKITFANATISQNEMERAQQLVETKYDHESWSHRI